MTTAKTRKTTLKTSFSALRERSRVEIGAAVGLVNGGGRSAARAGRPSAVCIEIQKSRA
jgi:hypothetical protein